MSKLLLAVLVGLVGAAVIHIAVIFTIPHVAEDNAWGRLSRAGDLLEVVPVSAAGQNGDSRSGFAFVDPAFMTMACRFSVEDGPVRLHADQGATFWSASIYSRNGDNLYSTNQRVAVGGRFDLVVGTEEQIETIRLEGFLPAEDTIPVTVAANELYLTLRAIVDDESGRPYVESFIRSLRCEKLPPPTAGPQDAGGAD